MQNISLSLPTESSNLAHYYKDTTSYLLVPANTLEYTGKITHASPTENAYPPVFCHAEHGGCSQVSSDLLGFHFTI